MKVKQALYCGVAAAALALVAPTVAMAQTVAVKAAEIGGVVTGASGPEAGVWVIAETTDLPTKFARIVVTDDQAAISFRICPRPTTRCGCAAMGSSIPQRCRPRPARS